MVSPKFLAASEMVVWIHGWVAIDFLFLVNDTKQILNPITSFKMSNSSRGIRIFGTNRRVLRVPPSLIFQDLFFCLPQRRRGRFTVTPPLAGLGLCEQRTQQGREPERASIGHHCPSLSPLVYVRTETLAGWSRSARSIFSRPLSSHTHFFGIGK